MEVVRCGIQLCALAALNADLMQRAEIPHQQAFLEGTLPSFWHRAILPLLLSSCTCIISTGDFRCSKARETEI